MLNFVKVISTKLDDKSRRLIKYLRLGKSDVRESIQAGPYGSDSNPIEGMIAIYGPTLQNGNPVIIGYVNKNQIADIGEHRIFSTDNKGLLKMFLHLKNNGIAEFGGDSDFMVRFSVMETAFNQLKADVNKLSTQYNVHVHPSPAGGVTGTTSVPAGQSTADISGARIEQIKTI